MGRSLESDTLLPQPVADAPHAVFEDLGGIPRDDTDDNDKSNHESNPRKLVFTNKPDSGAV